MALVTQEVGGALFLREGVVPEVGMMLYLQVSKPGSFNPELIMSLP
jgi:hypothetical protein